MKRLRGSGTHNSAMNRDNSPSRPSPLHGGSGRPKGAVRAPQPQVYGRHGGTNLSRALNKKQK